MIEAGQYVARAVDGSWSLRESSKGTPFIQVTFAILGGPFDGHTIRWDGFLSDRAAERTLESLRHCGWVGDDVSAIQALPEAVNITVEHDEYDGKVYARVRWVNPIGGRGIGDEMDRDKAKGVAARLRELARSVGRTAPPARSQPALQDEEDDIPF